MQKEKAAPRKDRGARMWRIELRDESFKVQISTREPQTFPGKVIKLVRTEKGWLQFHRKRLPVLSIDLFTGHAQPDLPLECPPSQTPAS